MSDDNPTFNRWPLWVRLNRQVTRSRGWLSENWQVAELSVQPDEPTQEPAQSIQEPAQSDQEPFHRLWLILYRDERIAYRFNLDSDAPKLFVVCEALQSGWVPRKLTLCQDVAADYMDGSQPVLSIPLPETLMLWAERFIAGQGDLPDPSRHKRRLRQQATHQQSTHQTAATSPDKEGPHE